MNSLRRETRLKVVGRFARFYSRFLIVSSSEILGLDSKLRSKGPGSIEDFERGSKSFLSTTIY